MSVAFFVTTNATNSLTTNGANIKVEAIGGGGGGSAGNDQSSGAGGEYRVIASQAYSSGSNFAVTLGAAGTAGTTGSPAGGNGGAANWNSILIANGGAGGTLSGNAAGGTGGTGGTGNAGGNGYFMQNGWGGPGGGGAGGPNGVGGAAGFVDSAGSDTGGGGGGGSGGGSAGVSGGSGATGSTGGNNFSSSKAGGAGSASTGSPGSAGAGDSNGASGGGGGCGLGTTTGTASNGGAAGTGQEWDATHGSGAGGGGGGGGSANATGGVGAAGGLYGGGGGSGGGSSLGSVFNGAGGAGGPPVLVITYTASGGGSTTLSEFTPFDSAPQPPLAVLNPRNRLRADPFSNFEYKPAAVVSVTIGGFTPFDIARQTSKRAQTFQDYYLVPPSAPVITPVVVGQPPGSLFSPNFGLGWNIIQRQAFPADIPQSPQFFGPFTPFDQAQRIRNFARDWIAFAGNISVTAPQYTQPFTPFGLAPKPINRISADPFQNFEFNSPATATVTIGGFTPFDRPARPTNFARDWIGSTEIITTVATVVFGGFTPFNPAPKPKNFALDWIANFETPPPAAVVITLGYFSPFDPAPKPRNLDVTRLGFQTFINAPGNPNQVFGSGHDWWPRAAKPPYYAIDWITQFGNISVDTLPVDPIPFSIFDPAPRPRNLDATRSNFQTFINAPGNPNQFFGSGHDWWPSAPRPRFYAVDWVSQIANLIPNPAPFNPMPFSPFGPAQRPRNFALDWTAYHPSNQFFTPTSTTSTMFMDFSAGRSAKLWSITGQQPQWWTYAFISPPSPPKPPTRRDTHDGDWIRKHKHPRHPPVYSEEYYEELRNKQRTDDDDALIEEIEQIVPNLLIPLDELIPPVDLPSLRAEINRLISPIDIPSLRAKIVDSQQLADDRAITQLLLSEIDRDRYEVARLIDEMTSYVQAPVVLTPRPVENVMLKLSEAIDRLHKAQTSRKRVVYDLDGRPIGVEPIPDEENPIS